MKWKAKNGQTLSKPCQKWQECWIKRSTAGEVKHDEADDKCHSLLPETYGNQCQHVTMSLHVVQTMGRLLDHL